MSNIKKKNQKGVSLYFAVLITSILLAMVLGVSAIIVSQIKMIKGMGDSVIALYAADTGIEVAMYNSQASQSDTVGDASYTVTVKCSPANPDSNCGTVWEIDSDCDTPYFCIKSIGEYKGTKRALEATR